MSLFIGLDRVSCKTDEPIEMSLGGGHDTYSIGVHIGATWRIRFNDPCAAAMRSVARITVATYFIFFTPTVDRNEI